jgi:hypothetical protein
MLNWFVLPNTLKLGKHTVVCLWLTLNWLFYFSSFSAFATSTSSEADPLWTVADQLRMTCGYAQSLHLAEWMKTVKAHRGMSNSGHWRVALPLLHLFLRPLFLQCWPWLNCCRTSPMDLWTHSVNLTCRVNQDSERTMGYDYESLATGCSTSPFWYMASPPHLMTPWNFGRSTLINSWA